MLTALVGAVLLLAPPSAVRAVVANQAAVSGESLGANAALKYWQAYYFMSKLNEPQRNIIAAYDTAPLDKATDALLQSSRTTLRYIHLGAVAPGCDWGLPPQDGVTTLLPHLNWVRDLDALELLAARKQVQDGQGNAAVDGWADGLALARNAGSGNILISLLAQCAIESMTIDAAAADLNRVPPGALDHFTKRLDALPAGGSFTAVIERERRIVPQWFIASLQQAKNDRDWQEKVFGPLAIPARDMNAAVQAAGGTPQGLIQKLQKLDPLYNELEQIVSLPPDQFEKKWSALHEKFKANPVSYLVAIPGYDEIYRARAITQARMTMLRAAVAIVRDGPARLKDFRDPLGHGAFEYRALPNGFELSSKLRDKSGKPVSLRVGKPTLK